MNKHGESWNSCLEQELCERRTDVSAKLCGWIGMGSENSPSKPGSAGDLSGGGIAEAGGWVG